MGSAWRSAAYRVRQFLDGLRPWLEPEEIAEVRAMLTTPELRLFIGMEGRDRKHSMRLMRWLERSGRERGCPPPPHLLKAALLHDVGKGRLATWHRVAFVLLNAMAPRFAPRLESPSGAGWRQALWRLRHHARLGAERLAAAGVEPRVVELVAGHTAPHAGDAELAWLIEADNHT